MIGFSTNSLYRLFLPLAFVAAFSLGFFLFTSKQLSGLGFPLDDAWIHQTYARNLIQRGEWSFIPGQPSAGSTSPLWSMILSIGYLLHFKPIVWTYFLGWVQLWLIALLSVYGLTIFVPERASLALWGGILMLLEFHLVWAAGSGMETLLFAILVTGFLIWLARPNVHWFAMGLWVGLSAWVRPDGITLLGPVVMVLVMTESVCKARLRKSLQVVAGFLLLFGPYLLFNRALAGAWWPNTFFAKQAEYSILLNQSLMSRFVDQLALPLIGVGIVLLPGFIYSVYRSVRTRRWALLAGVIWLIGYLLLYAWRLPVTYQHGRYVIPAMPVYFLFGLAGLIDLLDIHSGVMWRRILFKGWLLSGLAVLIAFWLRGSFAYAQDVAVIETEMVATATWVADHTAQEALIAAHDIGALGYFGDRQIVDLAGLVSPEVIPFIRDEQRLAAYLDYQQVDYLVTFPRWYPQLVEQAQFIHSTDGEISPSLGGENMHVYRWRSQ
jgi:hypothetical protein